jgi:hypothetical protein
MAGWRGIVVLTLLAIVMAAGRVAETGTDWPNEPAGFAALTDQPWDALTGGGWNRRFSTYDRIISDQTAPLSPMNVLEFVYPKGFAGGYAPASAYYPLNNTKEVFIGLWWKVSNPWQGHSSAVNKIQFVYLAGPADVAMVMYGVNGGGYDVRVLPQWREHKDQWLIPNVNNSPVTIGDWHRIEWYLKYDTAYQAGNGIIRWWLDGTLAGDYTDVRYPRDAGLVEYQLSPTWGGVGGLKMATDYYRFDHLYISVPSGTAPPLARHSACALALSR